MWPPARPDASAILHYAGDDRMEISPGIHVEITPLPYNNPNHLHVKIYADTPSAISVEDTGEVKYDYNRRLVDAYMLWWGN